MNSQSNYESKDVDYLDGKINNVFYIKDNIYILQDHQIVTFSNLNTNTVEKLTSLCPQNKKFKVLSLISTPKGNVILVSDDGKLDLY